MRILFVGLNATPEPTGIAPYTSGLAARLADEGHVVQHLTTFPHYPQWRFEEGRPPRTAVDSTRGVRVVRLRHRLPARGSSLSRVLSELSFGLRALGQRWGRPHAVVLVSPALFACAVLVPRLLLTRTPFVVWVQDLYGAGVREIGGTERLSHAASLVAWLEGWLLRRASTVAVIHEGMVDAVRRLGVAAERVTVVRNWTHIELPKLADRSALREQMGWAPDERVVLHTGNMGVKQDLENVVDAGRIAATSGARIRFVLMGDGTARPTIERAAAGVPTVQLLPPQPAERFGLLLQAADMLLVNEHPNLRGMALPSKLTSYFASGRPVIAATDARSTTALELERAAAGVQVPPGAPAALIAAVLELAEQPERMAAFATTADEYRRSALSLDGVAAGFLMILRKVAQLPEPTPLHAAAPVQTPLSPRERVEIEVSTPR